MDDPRKQAIPENANTSDRARIFAEDLAFGCDIQDWTTEFISVSNIWYFDNIIENHDRMSDRLNEYIATKWGNNPPSPDALV